MDAARTTLATAQGAAANGAALAKGATDAATGAASTAPPTPAEDADLPVGDGAHRAFSLDGSQRWALAHLGVVLAGILLATQVFLGLLFNPTLPAASSSFALGPLAFLANARPDLLAWFLVGLASLLGALLEVAWGIGYHAFWKKDYDPETVFFSLTKVVQAPVITLLAFATAAAVLPFEVGLEGYVTAFPIGLAILCGYYSDDLLDAVHRGFKKLLRQEAGVRAGKPLPKSRVYPLDALVDHPLVVPVVKGDVPRAVHALRRHGVTTTADLMGLSREELDKVAKEHEADPAALRNLQRFSVSIGQKASLREGVQHHHRVLQGLRDEARAAGEGKDAAAVPLSVK